MIIKSLKKVFHRPKYIFKAIIIALLVLIASIWLSIYDLIAYVITTDLFTLTEKIKILFSSLGAFGTNFTLTTQVFTILIAILAGINIAMLSYYFKKRYRVERSAGVSVLGVIGGFLGLGCASCGPVILSSFFGLTTTTAFISVLPLQGLEFGLLSIILLLGANYLVAKKIQSPLTCRIDK